jgi:hypothetical protein
MWGVNNDPLIFLAGEPDLIGPELVIASLGARTFLSASVRQHAKFQPYDEGSPGETMTSEALNLR